MNDLYVEMEELCDAVLRCKIDLTRFGARVSKLFVETDDDDLLSGFVDAFLEARDAFNKIENARDNPFYGRER